MNTSSPPPPVSHVGRGRAKSTEKKEGDAAQRPLIKAADFAGGEGARRFPTSGARPRKPLAVVPNRLQIARLALLAAAPPKKRTLASFPHSQAEVPLLHRGVQATERASIPKHGRCNTGAQPGRWATLPNTPLVARISTYLLKSPCWTLPHACAHHA
jgi:hypothetical protein